MDMAGRWHREGPMAGNGRWQPPSQPTCSVAPLSAPTHWPSTNASVLTSSRSSTLPSTSALAPHPVAAAAQRPRAAPSATVAGGAAELAPAPIHSCCCTAFAAAAIARGLPELARRLATAPNMGLGGRGLAQGACLTKAAVGMLQSGAITRGREEPICAMKQAEKAGRSHWTVKRNSSECRRYPAAEREHACGPLAAVAARALPQCSPKLAACHSLQTLASRCVVDCQEEIGEQ